MMSDPLPSVLRRLIGVLNEHSVTYALIGGLGVSLRSRIRFTRDIDLLVYVGQLKLPSVLESLRSAGFGLDLREAIEIWNTQSMLVLTCDGVRVDWLKVVVPAWKKILDRATWEEIDGQPVRVADAEGLIVLKLAAFRPQDQEDIRNILAANQGKLDLNWIRSEWASLVDDAHRKTNDFEAMVREYYGPEGRA